MSRFCCLLLAISTAASITVSVNATSAVEALKKHRDDYRKETEKTKAEIKSLSKKLKVVQQEVRQLQQEYQSVIENANNGHERTVKELEFLAFKQKELELIRQDKNRKANYLDEFSKTIAFVRFIAEEDVKIAEKRQQIGIEKKCIDYEASAFLYPPKRREIRVRSRFSETDDTADIILISGQRDIEKGNLEDAIKERDRIQETLEQQEILLRFKKSSWEQKIGMKYTTLESNEDKVAAIKLRVNELQEIIKKLDNQIKKLKAKIQVDETALKAARKRLTTSYKKGLSCYQAIVPITLHRAALQLRNILT